MVDRRPDRPFPTESRRQWVVLRLLEGSVVGAALAACVTLVGGFASIVADAVVGRGVAVVLFSSAPRRFGASSPAASPGIRYEPVGRGPVVDRPPVALGRRGVPLRAERVARGLGVPVGLSRAVAGPARGFFAAAFLLALIPYGVVRARLG
jgi:hypothetical protein